MLPTYILLARLRAMVAMNTPTCFDNMPVVFNISRLILLLAIALILG